MHATRLSRFAVCFTLCCMIAGCGANPHYKFEGTAEVKKLVIYKKDGSQISIDLGSAMGGGVWKFVTKSELDANNGRVQKTIETKDGVKFTLTVVSGGVPPVSVKDIFLDGKSLKSW